MLLPIATVAVEARPPLGPDDETATPVPDDPSATPGPEHEPTSAPSPEATPGATSTPGRPNPPSVPNVSQGPLVGNGSVEQGPNGTGGGIGAGIAAGFIDALGPIGDVIVNPGATTANATKQLAHGVILVSAYVPSPNRIDNWFRNPTNGMWPDRYEVYQEKARPVFWALAGITFALNMAGGSTGVFQNSGPGWKREWLFNFSAGYLGWQIAGGWLNIRRGLTYWLLQDVTAGGLETTVTAVLVIAAVIVLAFINIFALGVLLLIVGMVYGGVAFLTPWLGVLIMLRSFPLDIVAGVGDQLAKLWFVLTLLTLPIAAFLGAGFSLDVSSTFNASAVALTDPSASIMTAGQALLSLAVKFGSILGGILSAYWLFSGLQGVGMATGVIGAPSPDELEQRYQRGREKMGEVRERSKAAAKAPKEAVRGARGRSPSDPDSSPTRSYDAGRAVSHYKQAASERVQRRRGAHDRTGDRLARNNEDDRAPNYHRYKEKTGRQDPDE